MTQLSRGRALAALACALAALAAAVAAAVGPALPDRASYSWPPTSIPDKHPTRSWFAPLLLNTRAADALTARIPCSPGPPLTGVSAPFVVLATARHPRREHALHVTYANGTTSIQVGTTTLARFSNRPAPCTTTVHLQGSDWTIERTGTVSLHGHLGKAPTVNGLITQLDLHATTVLHATVTPRTQDTHPSGRQTLLRFLAALLTAVALWLAIDPRRSPAGSDDGALSRRFLTLPDATVGLTLLTWWIISPTYFDDGWVAARQRNSVISGGFSSPFDSFGVNLPLATWLEWMQQFVLTHTTALVVQRIPSLICLALVWVVVRALLVDAIGSPSRRGDVAWWSAALVFCTGAVGFGMTLRPEPLLALLSVGTLACAIWFARRPALAPLAIAVLLAGLAVTLHPAGLVALGPLLICLPRIVRELRTRVAFGPLGLATVVIAGSAWTILLAFLDSDVAHRRADAALIRAPGSGHQLGPLDELGRYGMLWQTPPVRREFVAVLFLLSLSVLLDRRARRRLENVLPAASVAVGLGLLAFAPSKWVWHFGGFAGIAGVAAGIEVRRLRERVTRSARWALASLAAVIVATALSSLGAFDWGPTDLRTFRWADIPFEFAVLVAVGGVMAAEAIVRRSPGPGTYRPVLWLLPVALASLSGITTIALIADSARASGWTAARQALTDLTGGSTCGLGDEIRLPSPASMVALTPVKGLVVSPSLSPNPSAPAPDGAKLLDPDSTSRWYRLPPGTIGFYLGGAWRRNGSIQVDWGRVRSGSVQTLARGTANLGDGLYRRYEPGSWRFVAESSLPPRPAGSDAVRLHVGSPGTRLPAMATSPISYRSTSLRSLIETPGQVTLTSPFLYANVPCSRLPAVASGVAESPSLLVDWAYPPALTFPTSPFAGAFDLYEIRRLPLERLGTLDKWVAVHTVLVDPRDAVAPVERAVEPEA